MVDLHAIKVRVAGAARGPWDHSSGVNANGVWQVNIYSGDVVVAIVENTRDAEFICRARTDIEDLLGEVERLRDVAGKARIYLHTADCLTGEKEGEDLRDALRAVGSD